MQKIHTIILFLLCVTLQMVQAQTAERAIGQVMVKLAPRVGVERPTEMVQIAAQRDGQQISIPALAWQQTLAADWRIQLYTFDEQKVSATEVLRLLRASADVEAAQLSYRSYDRAVPNDAEWFRQSSMTLIKAPEAWDLTTGGLTAQGDTIVLAILEKGYYREHPDYQANRWYNRLEIPDNLLDDDGNGYVDDFRGYDPRNQGDGPGNQSNHGTGVTGIAGAQGNNSIGISGVNWNVKLMNLTNVDYEQEIIAAYYYVHQMRKLYNRTNGAKGAFVVASNASFGIDKELAEDHPMWCEVYDSLGTVGVVSIGATSNQNVNVDIVGDMPTHCPSPYLITVTNVNQQDIKQPSGFGTTSIDIGAPGSGTVTTGYQGGQTVYNILGGTSSSAPHVTGVVGLIYSLKCAALTQESITDPILVAERVRDLIVQNLDDNISLASVTKYGGRLNAFKPLTAAKKLYCDVSFGDLAITDTYIDAQGKLQVRGVVPDNSEHLLRVHDAAGRLMFETKVQSNVGGFVQNIDASLACWPQAIYFVSLGKGKKVVAKKFFKF